MPAARWTTAVLAIATATAACEGEFPSASPVTGGTQPVDSAFLDLAFGDATDALRRYDDPILFEFAGFHTAQDTLRALEALDILEDATGLTIAHNPDPPEDTNFLIFWAPRDDFPALMPNRPLRWVQLQWNADYTLASTVVLVQTDNPPAARYDHMLEQLARGLGLRGPGHRLPDTSILRDGGTSTAYAARDLDILRTLYHPELTPGMTALEAGEALESGDIP